jgi:hypothetical protein
LQDCQKCTWKIGHFYILKDDVWQLAVPKVDGMLCLAADEEHLWRVASGTSPIITGDDVSPSLLQEIRDDDPDPVSLRFSVLTGGAFPPNPAPHPVEKVLPNDKFQTH